MRGRGVVRDPLHQTGNLAPVKLAFGDVARVRGWRLWITFDPCFATDGDAR